MNKPNLFERLEGYARENFTTEALAYILETNRKVRKKFLRLLLDAPNSREEPAAFGDYEIGTQVAYTTPVYAIIDLEITSRKKGAKKIYVEVKTQSQEGEGQIRKYLKLRGEVAYLTPLGFDSPPDHDNSRKYLGHFTWDKVHSIIESVRPNNVIQRQFLKYLEARHMGPSKPITSKELRAAAHAVALITKSQELVGKVRDKIEPFWMKQFDGKNVGAKDISVGVGDGDLPYWWYRPKRWYRKRRFFLSIGISKGDRRRKPSFYLQIGSSQKASWRNLDLKLQRQFNRLSGLGWIEEDSNSAEWGFSKFFPLHEGKIDEIALTQAKNVRSATEELQHLKIIKLMEERI